MKKIFKKYFKILAIALGASLVLVAIIVVHQQIVYYDLENTSKSRPMKDVATVYDDIPYCATDNKYQTLDLLIPKEPAYDKSPLIIYIHGGGWSEGDKENNITDEYASQIANLGIAAATVDYRLSTEVIYPAQNNDVACAVNFLIAHANDYSLDTSKIILIGDSAGGQLAAMEAITGKHEFLGVIMAYGVSDLNKQIIQKDDTNAVRYLGSKATELAESDSPAFAKSFPDTSFLLIHGTADSIVPEQESKDFAKILEKNGVSVEYVAIPNASHAFLGTGDASDEIARKAMFVFIANLLNGT